MNKKINLRVGMALGAALIFTSLTLPTFAQTITVSPTVKISLTARFANIVTRANEEIDRRITALNALEVRVNGFQKLSADEKSALSSNIQTQLTAMNNLKAQISTDASANNTSSLKMAALSITSSYRIFALVIPQGAIEAASDRVLVTGGIMTDLGAKLSARISAAQSAGTNVTAAESAFTDFNAKVSDANSQATVAANEVASLKPDDGNATIMASNTATLKDARTKILASQKDLVAANADAKVIVKALGITVSVSASSTTSVQ